MEQQAYIDFLGIWNLIMWSLTAFSVLVAVFLYLGYKIKYGSQKTLKDKFDLASEKQVKAYLNSNFVIAAAIFFFTNTASQGTVELSFIWFFIRIFIAICFATLYGYVA